MFECFFKSLRTCFKFVGLVLGSIDLYWTRGKFLTTYPNFVRLCLKFVTVHVEWDLMKRRDLYKRTFWGRWMVKKTFVIFLKTKLRCWWTTNCIRSETLAYLIMHYNIVWFSYSIVGLWKFCLDLCDYVSNISNCIVF